MTTKVTAPMYTKIASVDHCELCFALNQSQSKRKLVLVLPRHETENFHDSTNYWQIFEASKQCSQVCNSKCVHLHSEKFQRKLPSLLKNTLQEPLSMGLQEVQLLEGSSSWLWRYNCFPWRAGSLNRRWCWLNWNGSNI